MIWIANLDRLHAEKQLLFTDLSGASIGTIRDLLELTLDDQDRAGRLAREVYWARLANRIAQGGE